MATPFRAVLSPCTGVCKLDAGGYCEGCRRSIDEIAGWSTMGDDERLRIMEELSKREAARA